ncbi:MAG TPA: hypothetical protein VMW35_14690 [Myxococcota bacterium]|jgi:hypothetical protein|nr:hypothetical protein [Myxococcota bacterium]
MSDPVPVEEGVAQAIERARWAVLAWVILCAIVTQVATPPAAPPIAASNVGLYVALACAFVAIAARSVANASGSTARTRVRASLVAYAASALLGVIALGILFLQGDATRALGSALGGAIFAASGARVRPHLPPRPPPGPTSP